MADQGLWFKLWCSTLDDPDLDNLELCDFARWAKLGVLVKRHGTAGTLRLAPPARALCAMFRVPDFEALVRCFMVLPHVTVRRANGAVPDETVATVSFQNWLKYQGDFSTPRTRQFRQRERSRGEEKRREEMRRDSPPNPPEQPEGFSIPSTGSDGSAGAGRRGDAPQPLGEILRGLRDRHGG